MNLTHKKLMISLGCNIITFYLTGISNIWTQEQAIKNKNIYPLQDIGFKLIPYEKKLSDSNDYVLILIACLSFLLIIFHKARVEIVYRWSIMLNILFSIRIITIPSTILTRPVDLDIEWSSCTTLDYNYNRLLGPVEVLFKNKMTCFDFIYSGHMVNTVTCLLLIIKYVQLKYISFIWILSFVEAYFIIATRSHYLIDIEIAVILTLLFWNILEYREKIKQFKINQIEIV